MSGALKILPPTSSHLHDQANDDEEELKLTYQPHCEKKVQPRQPVVVDENDPITQQQQQHHNPQPPLSDFECEQIQICFHHIEMLHKWPRYHCKQLRMFPQKYFARELKSLQRRIRKDGEYESKLRGAAADRTTTLAKRKDIFVHRLLLGVSSPQLLPRIDRILGIRDAYEFPDGYERDPRGIEEGFYLMTMEDCRIADESRVSEVAVQFVNGDKFVLKLDLLWYCSFYERACVEYAFENIVKPNVRRTKSQLVKYFGSRVSGSAQA
jgi:hypothetical protein